MSEYLYHKSQGIIEVPVSGDVDLSEGALDGHYEKLLKLETSHLLRVLSIYEDEVVILTPLSSKIAGKLRRHRRKRLSKYSRIRAAIVTCSSTVATYVEFMKMHEEDEFDLIRLFSNRDEAIAWLTAT